MSDTKGARQQYKSNLVPSVDSKINIDRVQLKCDGTRWHTEGEVKGNRRMEWVASTLHTTSEHGVSSITTANVHTSAASSRLNWRNRRFKWTRKKKKKKKYGFWACAITFQTQSTTCPFRILWLKTISTWHCLNPLKSHRFTVYVTLL
jgi:hypothetical protein